MARKSSACAPGAAANDEQRAVNVREAAARGGGAEAGSNKMACAAARTKRKRKNRLVS